MIKGIVTALSVLIMLFCTGCAKYMLDKPQIPQSINVGSPKLLYTENEFKDNLEEYKKAYEGDSSSNVKRDLEKARLLRDAMINRIRVDIEMNYREYEARLFNQRNAGRFAGDLIELGIAFATTVSGGEAVKTVLAAVQSGVKGTRLSFDKNFFREKTVEVVISKMQASRERVKNRILDKMINLPADKYTFEEAWVDLIEFFYAGTLQGGIQALVSEAAQDAAKAKEETKELELRRTITSSQVASLEELRAGFSKLYKKWVDVQNSSDAAKPFVDKAKIALTELKVELKGTESDKKIFDLLNQQLAALIEIKDSSQLDKRLQELTNAFRKAGIII